MPRTAAWIVLIASSVFAYTLAFTPYDHLTNRYASTEGGGLTRVSIECPSPVSVLFFDAEPESARDEGACEMSARGHLIEAILLVGFGLLLAYKPVTRRRPERIGPLSAKLDK